MVFPLSEGTYTVDNSKDFIPFDAAKDHLENRPASLLVDIVPFLIKTKSDLVIIDPGLGLQSRNGDYMIHENIRARGFSPDDVTMVLLSHLHKDHASGICYGREPAFNLMFPKATYYCQRQEMEYSFQKNDSPSFVLEKLEFLKHTPNLSYLDGDGNINDAVQYEVSGGHTPHHQVFTIESDGQKYFYGGDVLPQPNQLLRKFSAKYDFDGKLAADKRIEYGKRAAAENLVCLFFHSANMPMAKVRLDEEGKFLLEKV